MLNVALLQLVSAGTDVAANERKAIEHLRKASELGADIALLPEMWNIGYARCPVAPSERDAWRALAVPVDSAEIRRYRDLAHELGMAIVYTYLEAYGADVRNAATLIDRHGEVVFTYAKVHTCDFDVEVACRPGAAFPVGTLDTAIGKVRIGIMICYDREFPESARLLMLGGAEIILTPNACFLEASRLGQFRARAFENMVGVAMANYAAPQQNGRSVAYDGVVFDRGERPVDPELVIADDSEGVIMAAFDLDRLRDYRRRECWADGYRKPSAYGGLLGDGPAELRRADARR